MSLFTRATRTQVYLKLGMDGGPGTGKTTSSLRLASGFCDGKPIAVLDTENGSASLYADQFCFDVMTLTAPFSDDKYVAGIKGAVDEGYGIVIVDSLSHGWESTLDFKANLDAKGGNSYTNWAVAGKKFKAVMNAILQSPIHVICCMRSKMEYTLETDIRGKQVPRKIGMQPMTRDGTEYEFAVVFDCGADHWVTCSKDRTGLYIDQHFQVTEETGLQLRGWLNSAPPPPPEPTVQEKLATELADIDPETLSAYLVARGAAPDGSVLSVPDGFASKGLAALPQLRAAIDKFRQEAATAAAEPVTTTAE